MRIVVVGAGAVGCYFGGRLAEAGHEVGFLARGGTLAVLRESGLRITSQLGDAHLRDVEVHDDPEAFAEADAAIVAVKAWQVPDVAPKIAAFLRPGGVALPLQNGVEAPAQLAEELGEDRVLGGLCKIICRVEEPGHVIHFGAHPYIALGELHDRSSERLTALRDTLESAGIRAEIPGNIEAAMWEKFLFICAVSGLGAVTRATLGAMRREPATRSLLERAMHEIAEVASASGVSVAGGLVERTMAFADSLPAEATMSMQRDIMKGRPSELESQNGAVVRLGRRAGVETPVHEFLYSVLLLQEDKARSAAS
ncbi:MAG: 2-dehydropantoate 2-reductase [Thermoanaerobaculia bacterium]|nr:2-dehydropantoate 2-reductase [Thermoanaerobaculia bacterium]